VHVLPNRDERLRSGEEQLVLGRRRKRKRKRRGCAYL
jgi:hypothetical protein